MIKFLTVTFKIRPSNLRSRSGKKDALFTDNTHQSDSLVVLFQIPLADLFVWSNDAIFNIPYV